MKDWYIECSCCHRRVIGQTLEDLTHNVGCPMPEAMAQNPLEYMEFFNGEKVVTHQMAPFLPGGHQNHRGA